MAESVVNLFIALISAVLGGLFGGFFAEYFARMKDEKIKKKLIENSQRVLFEDMYHQMWYLKEYIREYHKLMENLKSDNTENFLVQDLNALHTDTFDAFSKPELYEMIGKEFIRVTNLYKTIGFFTRQKPYYLLTKFNQDVQNQIMKKDDLKSMFLLQLEQNMELADKLIFGIDEFFGSGAFPFIKPPKFRGLSEM